MVVVSLRRITLLLLILFCSVKASGQTGIGLQLRAIWNDGGIKEGFGRYNSCWGYTDTLRRNYAILGGPDSIYFLTISKDGRKVSVCDRVKSSSHGCTNREFKTYSHYAYCVSDQCEGGKLEIFDLQYLPDSVHLVYSSSDVVRDAHTITIWKDRLYFSGPTRTDLNPGGIITLNRPVIVQASITNPESPVLVQALMRENFPQLPDYVHDMTIRGDTVWASCGPQGLYIMYLGKPMQPRVIQTIAQYPDQGYSHNSALTDDGTLLFTDETNGLRVKCYDVSQITSNTGADYQFLSLMGINYDKGSIAHNVLVKGKQAWIAYYQEGVVVYDISNPAKPILFSQFDTYPQNNSLPASEKI